MLLGASSVLNGFSTMVLFAAFVQASFMFFVLPALADTFDIDEDKQFGMKTMAMVLSWKQKSMMMLFAPILVIIATLISFIYLGFHMVSSVLIILFSLFLLKKMSNITGNYDEQLARKVRKLCFAYFTFLPVLMTIGTLNLVAVLPF
jgi:1,4-dihydroxy-2-naphthoate octaprenyltransferase